MEDTYYCETCNRDIETEDLVWRGGDLATCPYCGEIIEL
jgi:DNA-directed RNA polymerase subunit RPC12/RpoP